VRSPTSHLAGPVRSSEPWSQEGSFPRTGKLSSCTSRSSDSKPLLAVAVDVCAVAVAGIVPPESFAQNDPNRTIELLTCQARS
jgi:hypothetical protein